MKFTNAEMLQAVGILKTLHEKGKLGYAIAKNQRKIQAEVKEYADLYDAALTKFGTPGNKPGLYTLTPEAQKNVNTELEGLAEIESDVDILTVSEEEFCSGNLTSDQMAGLLWMVEEVK